MKIIIYAVLLLFLVLSLLPTVLMFFTSFVPEGDLFNKTLQKVITDFEAPRTVLMTRVRPINASIEFLKEEDNTFARLQLRQNPSGLAFSLGSSDINRVKGISFMMRSTSPVVVKVGFKDIKEQIEYIKEKLVTFSGEWKQISLEIDKNKLSIDSLHVSQLRIEVSSESFVDIDDVKFINKFPTFYNFFKVLREDYFGRYLLNSLIVSSASVIGNLYFCSLVAYVFARKSFRLKEFLFSIVLGTMMIPPQVTIIPTFVLMKKMGLLDTYFALILPNLVTPFGIFLMRQYIEQLPVELDHAALVDGANSFQIFWYVILPLSRPALSVLAINTFVLTWNDVFYPLILTTSRQMRTVQIGLALYQKLNVFTWPTLMAASTIAGLPIIIAFLIFEKRIIAGILEGAVKG